MTRLTLTLAVTLMLVTATARAQAVPPAPYLPALQHEERPAEKSEGVALGLALGGFVVPTALGAGMAYGNPGAPALTLLALGIGVGPSLGHFYAGEVGHGLLTSLGRLGGGTLAAYGLVGMAIGCESGGPSCSTSGATLAFAAGTALTTALVIYDLIDAPGAARRANESNFRVEGVAPVALMSPGQGATYGLAVVGRF